ncbi:MAG: hypothetical protein M0T82_00795 [Desulfobacteraceae bacterium]|nr:hypothetical protein [Desulfobacteraceae bacterium]
MKTFKAYIFLGINSYILYAVILVVFSLSRAFNVLTVKDIFIISVIISGFLKYLLYKKEGKEFSVQKRVVLEAVYLALFLIIAAGSSQFYDITYDGRAYHQEAIIRLAQGYNPYYQQLDEDQELHALWINHYPKAMEIVSSAVYAFTGNIETGKAFNLLFMISNILMGIGVFLRWGRLSQGAGLVFAMILGLNPVAVCQSLTYYVDGQTWSLLLAGAYLIFLFVFEKKMAWNMILALVIFSLANIKFTSLVYLMVMMAGYYLILLLTRPGKELIQTAMITGAAILIAVFFIGFNPYVTNTLINGHPFYPVYGENKVDIITGNAPHEFKDKNRFEKFYLSFLGRSGNLMRAWSDEKIDLKPPFTFDLKEIKAMAGCDVRVAGFGPLFSGIFLVSALLYVLNKRVKWGTGEKENNWFSAKGSWIDALLFFVVLSVVINPEFWWARYVPQLWAVPVLMLLGSGFSGKKPVLALVPVAFYLVSIFIISTVYIGSNIKETRALNRELEMLSESTQKMAVYFENFRSDRLKLMKKGIAYIEIKDDADAVWAYENTLLGHGAVLHNDESLYTALKAIH